MIQDASIQALKARLDIVEVVGSYLSLKKKGANFTTNCPFHSENTGSFTVSPQKQIYHCFVVGGVELATWSKMNNQLQLKS